MSKRPTFEGAVEWIALNDDISGYETPEELAGCISVALVADLFEEDAEFVAREVMRVASEIEFNK